MFTAKDISKKYEISNVVAEILVDRGINTEQKLNKFFNSSLEELDNLDNIPNIDKAINKISTHATLGSILLFCDYDADGLTSAVIMYKAIKKLMPEADINILPSNRFRDGYSLSYKAIDIIDRDYPETTLVITLDCGISSNEEIELLKERGYEYLVIDHHNPDKNIDLYEDNFVNLKAKQGDYSINNLCNAGITWRVCQKLLDDTYIEVIDLVTVATIADVVPLIGENRIIVKKGLEYMNNGNIDEGLKHIAKQINKSTKNMKASDIAYGIGPSINSCGRLNGVEPVLDILLYNERRPDKSIPHLAYKISKVNTKRKNKTNKIFDRISKSIDPDVNVIVAYSEGIGHGLVGIIAGKLQSRYRKPAIVIDLDEGKGSARSMKPFNIYKNLKKCEEEGLIKSCGGHNMAAGLQVDVDLIEEFAERLNELAEDIEYKDKRYDRELSIDKLDKELMEDINMLRPFGRGNNKPLFKTQVEVTDIFVIKNRHIKFKANGVEAIAFNMKHKEDKIKSGNIDMIYEPRLKGNKVEIIVRDVL